MLNRTGYRILPLELRQAAFQFSLFSRNAIRQDFADLLMQTPELVGRHAVQAQFHCAALARRFV
jgi:hypothetical protein